VNKYLTQYGISFLVEKGFQFVIIFGFLFPGKNNWRFIHACIQKKKREMIKREAMKKRVIEIRGQSPIRMPQSPLISYSLSLSRCREDYWSHQS
jgi:hypothetical protein